MLHQYGGDGMPVGSGGYEEGNIQVILPVGLEPTPPQVIKPLMPDSHSLHPPPSSQIQHRSLHPIFSLLENIMGMTQLLPYYHPRDESPPRNDHHHMIPHSHAGHSHDHRPGRSRVMDLRDMEPDTRRSRSAVPRGQQHGHTNTPRQHSTASSHSRNGHRRPHSEGPKANKRAEHAVEKAIGAGSAAAFHLRNTSGSWVGGKGLKVAGAASVAALIDYTLDQDPKSHVFRHIALSMIQGGVTEAIIRSGGHDSQDRQDRHDSHGSHHRHGQYDDYDEE